MCCRLHCSVVLAAQKTLVPSLASQRWNSSLLSESPRVIVPFLQQHRLLGRTAAVLSISVRAQVHTGPDVLGTDFSLKTFLLRLS